MNVDFRLWVLVILLPIILFSWIRNLDSLASLSALANVCILVGLVLVFYDEITKLVAHGTHEAAVKHGELKGTGKLLSLAMFFGTAVFAYEAIGVVGHICYSLPLSSFPPPPLLFSPLLFPSSSLLFPSSFPSPFSSFPPLNTIPAPPLGTTIRKQDEDTRTC